jgi:hypothetical protein
MKDPFDAEAMEGLRYYAKYIAMVVRNAMEDFHCRRLSAEQMVELNPIIRHAISTAMYAYHSEKESKAAARFVSFHLMSIPKYWEEPELLPGFKGEH